MKILMAASELAPFAQTGELGNAVSELSGELRKLGHEVSVAIPFYRAVREGKLARSRKTPIRFSVEVGTARMPCEVFEAKAANGTTVYLVARDEFFDRTGTYGVDGRDYQDNAARFIYFTKCVLELARRMDPPPQILHANSWETALAPVFVRDQRLPFRTVLTPHTLEYQGNFWSYDFALTNLPPEYFSARGVEYYGSMNCLKGGILFADAVVLPGERFASEAQMPDYGCGLENVLRENQHKLCGILSDAGLEGWDPRNDATLAAGFSAEKPADRVKNRAALLKAIEFAEDSGRLFVAFAEATAQKGLDVLLASLDRLLAGNARILLMGNPGQENTFAFEEARRKHRGRFAWLPDDDEKLSRLVLAGADFLLLPGAVEPRTVWLRRALRYGAVPVALQCGGLFQIVRHWELARNSGNGFVFHSSTVDGLVDACRHAMKMIDQDGVNAALRAECLGADFSATAAAQTHEALYERLLGLRQSARAA